MKPVICLALIFVLFHGVCVASEESPLLKNEIDSISYSLGYQIGGDFKRQGMVINADLVVKGVQAALSETDPLLTPEEMRGILINFKKKVVTAENEQRKEAAAENLANGLSFLHENSEKPEVVTLGSGLQYRIVKEGTGTPPKTTDMVTVHYRGTLIDGTEFDSSYERGKPATFRADRVIKGWKEALQLMKPGAKYELFLPPELAYGERGGGGKVGPNATLIFQVELLNVQPEEMTVSEHVDKNEK